MIYIITNVINYLDTIDEDELKKVRDLKNMTTSDSVKVNKIINVLLEGMVALNEMGSKIKLSDNLLYLILAVHGGVDSLSIQDS